MNKQLTVGVITILTLATAGTITMATLTIQLSFGALRDDSIRGGAISMPTLQRSFQGGLGAIDSSPDAPIAISGENIYIAWWTNKTGNDEIIFRASTDGGTTFTDKINLSNSTDADSQDVQIAADGDKVTITWWERNQTADEPVAKISSDNGATFGPLLILATNGTVGQASAEE